MAHDVFISYSTHDKPFADAACGVLEKRGLRCWIAPRDIMPGAEWGEAIVEAINDARAFVLVFSAHANASAQIKREVERAVNKGLSIVPVRIEDVAPTKTLEYFISTPHWLDALSPPLEKHLNYLADVLVHIVRGETKPGPQIIPGPVFRLTPAMIAGGIGAAVIAAVGLWLVFARPDKPGTPFPTDQALQDFDARLTGTWTLNVPTAAGAQLWTMQLSNGRYLLTIRSPGETRPYHERGEFRASDGTYHWTPPQAAAFDGRYRVISADAIEITGPLGTAMWSRKD